MVAKVLFTIGAALILVGIVIPTSTLLEFLRTVPDGLREQLKFGAIFFKAGLVLDGVFVMSLGWIVTGKSRKPDERRLTERYHVSPWYPLAFILLAAFLLRMYNLNLGIWFDEIVTYIFYVNQPFGEILTTYDNQNNHLLYTIIAHLSFLTFGESVWTLRLPAVLFGVGSIWALYRFSCQVGTWKEGLLSASILTFSYHHVWFSQNARGYTALLFWTLFSSSLLIRALRGNRVGLWLMYGVTVALGLVTHLTMAFVIVGQGLVFLLNMYRSDKTNRRQKWLGGILGIAVAALLSFQLYALVLPQLFNLHGDGVGSWQGEVAVAVWKSPIWMLGELLKGLNISLGNGIIICLAIFVFGVGLFDFSAKKSPIVILLLVPVLLSVMVIMALGSTLVPRLFFFAVGFAVIIVVRGLMLSGEFGARKLQVRFIKGSTLGVVMCVVLIISSAISVSGAFLPKQDFAGAMEFVQEKRRSGDVVVIVGLTVIPYERFYKVDWQEIETLEELNKVRTRGGRTWLVYTMPVVLKAAHPEIMKSIQIDFEPVKEFPGTLNGGNIVVALAKS